VRLHLRLHTRLKHFRKNRADRIGADDTNIWILLLQKSRDSRDGTARSHTDDDMGHFTVRLFPDFRTRRLVMSVGIRGIFILIGKNAVRDLAAQAKRNRMVATRVVMIDLGRGNDDFSAESAKRVDLLLV